MVSRISSVMDLHDDKNSAAPYAGYEDEAGWDSSLAEETWQEPRRNLSLARRLENSHHLAGRTACWLFVKGGMAVVLLSGIVMLGLIGALIGAR